MPTRVTTTVTSVWPCVWGAALAQGKTEVTVVVTLVGMERVRSATGPAARLGADGLDGVDGGEHHLRIVHVRGAHRDRERDAVGVDHKMAEPPHPLAAKNAGTSTSANGKYHAPRGGHQVSARSKTPYLYASTLCGNREIPRPPGVERARCRVGKSKD